MPRRWGTAVALALAFAALTALVWAGRVTALDQWAVDHLMPTVEARRPTSLLWQLVPFRHPHGAFDVFADAALLVGHPFVTAALAVWLASRSSRPGAILAGFAVAVAIEVIAKHVVARPSLHLGSYHLAGFDHSFPSGHMTRTMYLALVAAAIFPRAAGALATGLVVVAVLLVASANHTPSDVVGGAALGALVAIVVNPRGDAGRTSR